MNTFKVTFPGNKKVNVEFGNFIIKTDQKKIYGGDDTAPEPFNIFLSSIGSCAGIYAVSFCETRELNTKGMYLLLDISFKERENFLEEIKLTLYVNKEFPEKYIKPIIKSMNSCAVKNQLHPDIKINTTVVLFDKE
ncbi:MAG: OsmC family protein [Spirochaetales bacterium]|nr:OsmC family protein [Spirochaetales bacterium]